MSGKRFWFADWDDDEDTPEGWQPCLETGEGMIPSFDIWFQTKEQCEAWIRDTVIGAQLEDSP